MACEEKARLQLRVIQLQVETSKALQVVESHAQVLRTRAEQVQKLSAELAAQESAVLARILRRATLPEKERPRRAVDLAKMAKMDARSFQSG